MFVYSSGAFPASQREESLETLLQLHVLFVYSSGAFPASQCEESLRHYFSDMYCLFTVLEPFPPASVKNHLRHYFSYMYCLFTVLEPFPPASVVSHYPLKGHPEILKCVPPRSYPKADIFWATVVSNERFNPIDLTDRVTMDPEGNLHFYAIHDYNFSLLILLAY